MAERKSPSEFKAELEAAKIAATTPTLNATLNTPATVVKQTREEKRLKDRQQVQGIFRFYEVPGGMMSFSFKVHKGDPVERFDLQDGRVYTVPLGVAKHLNKNGWYPEYSYMAGEDNLKMGYAPDGYKLNPGSAPLMRVTKKVRRFGFQSLEFLDHSDINPQMQVLAVETVNMGSLSL